ncbi:type II toxin-antitoxin system Phd/YefM family antitoxin [Magnetospira thiophila]
MSHPCTWQLQEAKAKFSELVRRATREGPQMVTFHGEEAAVVLSAADYHRLQDSRPTLTEYLKAGPRFDDEVIDLVNLRASDTGRDLDL